MDRTNFSVLQERKRLKKGTFIMQKTKILQTLSVIGLTALCSIQSVEARRAWTVDLERVATPDSLRHSFVQLSMVHQTGGDVVDIARYQLAGDLRGSGLQSMPLALEPTGDFAGNRKVQRGEHNAHVRLTVGFITDSGSVSDMKCFVKTAQGADSYMVRVEDLGKTWSELLGKVWPESSYHVIADFSSGTLQCSEGTGVVGG
jgi:hypothetical protein